ncbi:hypothetical protein BDV38DRAFT_234230 [Aspergillus pseudotamarii]|uniref:Uncharacterized protein n=1 Tax=Aspergillus pseudotamarii TaxID=132259 RepID=A0A5N6T944_ASPPS|nr:uncharacterized protein BDV38DRAFT_234230 [Aspergillus pseudotamarii]KAE8142894.1 hypothetical protein BDV38DRAFT_234230 [Aspergillus pseudotamarii]
MCAPPTAEWSIFVSCGVVSTPPSVIRAQQYRLLIVTLNVLICHCPLTMASNARNITRLDFEESAILILQSQL